MNGTIMAWKNKNKLVLVSIVDIFILVRCPSSAALSFYLRPHMQLGLFEKSFLASLVLDSGILEINGCHTNKSTY
jgi:hypothetical protein